MTSVDSDAALEVVKNEKFWQLVYPHTDKIKKMIENEYNSEYLDVHVENMSMIRFSTIATQTVIVVEYFLIKSSNTIQLIHWYTIPTIKLKAILKICNNIF